MFMSQRLRNRKLGGMVVAVNGRVYGPHRVLGFSCDLSMVGQKFFEVFRTQDRDFSKQELSLDEGRSCVVEHSPHWNKIFQLSSGLFNDTIETAENNGHAGQIRDFSVADHE